MLIYWYKIKCHNEECNCFIDYGKNRDFKCVKCGLAWSVDGTYSIKEHVDVDGIVIRNKKVEEFVKTIYR